MSTSGLYHFISSEMHVPMEVWPSAVAFVRNLLWFVGKLIFAKYGHERGSPASLLCAFRVDRVYSGISKVRSTWKYVEFNGMIPLLWRWVRQPRLHALCMLLSMGSCVIIETQFFRFTILNVLHIWRARAWVDVCTATSCTYMVPFENLQRDTDAGHRQWERRKSMRLPPNHGFSECGKSKQSDIPYGRTHLRF